MVSEMEVAPWDFVINKYCVRVCGVSVLFYVKHNNRSRSGSIGGSFSWKQLDFSR